METRNFPKEFLVCSSFCLGEPGGSRKLLGVLPVYSSFDPVFSGQTKEFSIWLLVSSWFPFDPLHFNQSQKLEVDDAKCTTIIVLLQSCHDSSAACSLPSFRCFVATLGAKEYPQVLNMTCRYSVLLPESKIGEFSESSPEMLRRAY